MICEYIYLVNLFGDKHRLFIMIRDYIYLVNLFGEATGHKLISE